MTDLPEWTGPDAPDLSALPQLTALEAFDAMRLFVEGYWERGLKASDDLRVFAERDEPRNGDLGGWWTG